MTLFRDPSALAELRRRHHIYRLALFGSTLSGAAWPDGDVDLLVEFESGTALGLIGMVKIENELSTLLDRVLRESVVQHAA